MSSLNELPRKQKITYLIFVISILDLSWFFYSTIYLGEALF